MAPKFALFTKGSKLPLNKGFKNMFELQQSCAQPSDGTSSDPEPFSQSHTGSLLGVKILQMTVEHCYVHDCFHFWVDCLQLSHTIHTPKFP